MVKKIILFVGILFSSGLNAQVKGLPVEGKCFEIIQALRLNFQNDTLAINYFKDFYTVPKISDPKTFYKKDISEFIHFFNSPKRKDSYKCYMRGWREKDVLLIK